MTDGGDDPYEETNNLTSNRRAEINICFLASKERTYPRDWSGVRVITHPPVTIDGPSTTADTTHLANKRELGVVCDGGNIA